MEKKIILYSNSNDNTVYLKINDEIVDEELIGWEEGDNEEIWSNAIDDACQKLLERNKIRKPVLEYADGIETDYHQA